MKHLNKSPTMWLMTVCLTAVLVRVCRPDGVLTEYSKGYLSPSVPRRQKGDDRLIIRCVPATPENKSVSLPNGGS